jgi:hypothetical protein
VLRYGNEEFHAVLSVPSELFERQRGVQLAFKKKDNSRSVVGGANPNIRPAAA